VHNLASTADSLGTLFVEEVRESVKEDHRRQLKNIDDGLSRQMSEAVYPGHVQVWLRLEPPDIVYNTWFFEFEIEKLRQQGYVNKPIWLVKQALHVVKTSIEKGEFGLELNIRKRLIKTILGPAVVKIIPIAVQIDKPQQTG